MSETHHEEHHLTGPKPVSFTVPFILACATLLIVFLFLSICDPKAHHGHGNDGHHATEAPASGHKAVEGQGSSTSASHDKPAEGAAHSSH